MNRWRVRQRTRATRGAPGGRVQRVRTNECRIRTAAVSAETPGNRPDEICSTMNQHFSAGGVRQERYMGVHKW